MGENTVRLLSTFHVSLAQAYGVWCPVNDRTNAIAERGVQTMRKLIPVAIGLPLIAGAVILAVSNLRATVQGKPVGAKAADCCPAASTLVKAAPASADDCCDGGSCCH